MMNKKYILGLFLGLTFASCSDFLDRESSTALPDDEAIETLSDLRNAINGVNYLLSEDRMTYSADFAIYADLKGEDFKSVSRNNQAGPLSKYTITQKEDIPEYAYEYFYKAIANVNKALSYIDNVTYTDSQKATFNDYVGQLYAMRALLHFDLARMFCVAPTASDDVNAENSGIVLSTKVYKPGYVAPRATLKQTYDQILSDFQKALPLLSDDKNNGYINRYAALALRSRVYLYNGDNEKALEDAKAVIANKDYSLYSIDKYVESWSKKFDSESIYELNITEVYNAQRNSVGYYCDATGYGECAFNASSDLFKYLSANKDDVRSKLVRDQTSARSNKGYYPAKYPGVNGNIYVNDPKIIRLSDVYLIAAEAALKTNKDAVSYINAIRKNRIENYKDVSSVTLDDILMERRIELFAENSMAFDYWRNKKSIKNPNAGVINYDDYRTVLPIPQREIDNAKGILVQNAGY